MRIWAIANQKGGVGKTTTTVSMGGILAKAGKRVLLIDLDPHGSLSSYLGIDPETVENSMYPLFRQIAAGEDVQPQAMIHTTEFDGLGIIPASTAMATLEKQYGTRSGMGLVLQRALDAVADDYDNVLIDCPPMLGLLMINALAACKRVIIPVQTEHLAIKGMERMLRTMQMIQQSLNADIAYTILPTMYDQRTVACRQSLQRLQNDHRSKMTRVVIPIDTRLRDASHQGKPINYLPGDSQGQQAYQRFVSLLSGRRQKQTREVA